jgi:hypothetical protein
MALALPYPDMDFVPLDILLASELNQMVANIEYLANEGLGRYYPGDVVSYRDTNVLVAGRQRARAGSPKEVAGAFVLEKPVDISVTGVTFTQLGYVEAFGENSTIFSSDSPSDFVISCSLSRNSASNLIRMTIRPQSSSVTIAHNHSCVIAVDGKFTFT